MRFNRHRALLEPVYDVYMLRAWSSSEWSPMEDRKRSRALMLAVNRRLWRTVANCLSSEPDNERPRWPFVAINTAKNVESPDFLQIGMTAFCLSEFKFRGRPQNLFISLARWSVYSFSQNSQFSLVSSASLYGIRWQNEREDEREWVWLQKSLHLGGLAN